MGYTTNLNWLAGFLNHQQYHHQYHHHDPTFPLKTLEHFTPRTFLLIFTLDLYFPNLL